jgi:hypothetical protein
LNQRSRVIRNVALAVGLLYLVAAGIVVSVKASQALLIYLLVAGVLVIVGVLTMGGRYKPDVDRERGYWQMTGERFRDPASGHTMEVRFNPVTGERDYVDVDASSPS